MMKQITKMKTKVLSVLLSSAMLLSMVPMTASAALDVPEWTTALSEDFSSEPSVETLEGSGNFYTYSTDDGNYGKFTANPGRVAINLTNPIDATSGKLYVDFDFRPHSNGQARGGVVSLANSSGNDGIALFRIRTAGGTPSLMVMGTDNNTDTDIYFKNGSDNSTLNINGGLKWYSYHAEIDMESHRINAIITTQDGAAFIGGMDKIIPDNNTAFDGWSSTLSEFGKIAMKNFLDIDNISIKSRPLGENEIYARDFENKSAVTNFSSNNGISANVSLNMSSKNEEETDNHYFYPEVTSSKVGFWLPDEIAEGQFSVEFRFRSDGLGATNEIMLGDAAADSVVKILTADQNGQLSAGGSAINGAVMEAFTWYRYHADINLDSNIISASVSGHGGSVLGSTTASFSDITFKNIAFLGYLAIDDLMISHYVPTADEVSMAVSYIDKDGVEGSIVSENTRQIKLVFSEAVEGGSVTLDGSPVEGAYSDDDTVYTAELGALEADSTHTIFISGFKSKSSQAAVDERTINITVENLSLLLNKNFENENDKPFNLTSGGQLGTFKRNAEDSTGNHYWETTAESSKVGFSFDEVNTGILKFNFDFSPVEHPTNKGQIRGATVMTGEVKPGEDGSAGTGTLTLLRVYSGDSTIGVAGDNNTKINIKNGSSNTTISLGTWYSYEAEVDISARHMTVKVTTRDSGETVGALDTVIPERAETDTIYTNWPTADVFKHFALFNYINIDNIKVERKYKTPSPAVTIRTADGKVSTDMQDVDPASTAIDIEFGELMDEASLNGAVTLTKGGENVSITKSQLAGSVYTIEFDPLAPLSDYTLTISQSVKNINGDSMNEDYTASFKTREGAFTGTINSVKSGDAAVENGGTLTGNATVNVTVTNVSGYDKTAILYIAYYDSSNKLLDVKAKEIAVSNGAAVVDGDYNFGIEKPEGTTSIKVMLWDNEVRPLCAYRFFI